MYKKNILENSERTVTGERAETPFQEYTSNISLNIKLNFGIEIFISYKDIRKPKRLLLAKRLQKYSSVRDA